MVNILQQMQNDLFIFLDMATNFNINAIASGGGFKPTTLDTPLDIRSRINSLEDVEKIPNPYIGMIFYSIEEDKHYKVQSLKDNTSGVIVIKNSIVDKYSELGNPLDLSYEVINSNV